MSKKGPAFPLLAKTYIGGFLNRRSEELEHRKSKRNVPFQLEGILSPFRFLFPLGEGVGPVVR